jgi:hypothetical protein
MVCDRSRRVSVGAPEVIGRSMQPGHSAMALSWLSKLNCN